MTNALAVRNTALTNPAGFGDKRAIAAIRDRIMSMMPGAADAPADVVWAAAQLAVAYRLDPFNGEIYIIKLGSKKVGDQWVDDYRAHVGVKGLRKKAREQAQFMTDFRDLSEAEVSAARRGDYDAGDIGVECVLYRLDIAQQCQRMGIPYKPFRATGYWRVKAKRSKDSWTSDNIPNTWTAHDVAEKRAEINAIKRGYDLTINVADPALMNDDEAIEVIGRRIGQIDEDDAPMQERDHVTDTEDGDVLFYHDVPPNAARSARQSAPPEYLIVEGGLPAADNPFTDTAPIAPATDDTDILRAPEVHEAVKGLVEKLRSQEKPGARKASGKQQKFAVGVIDGITGKDSHRLVFQAVFDRDVSGESPLAEAAAQLIFKLLCPKKSAKNDAGEWAKIENPDYDPTMVEFVNEIHRWAIVNLAGEPMTA